MTTTTTTTKITKKDRYNAIIAILTGVDGDQIDELIEFCEHEIELLDKKSAKTKEAAAEKKAAPDALLDAVQAVLTADFQTIPTVTAALDPSFDATASKVGYRLKVLVEAGVAVKEQISIPATNGGKGRKAQAYKLA